MSKHSTVRPTATRSAPSSTTLADKLQRLIIEQPRVATQIELLLDWYFLATDGGAVMTAPRSVLPASVRRLPLGDKLQRLAQSNPETVHAIDVLVDGVLGRCWRTSVHAGPRGGLKLKSTRPTAAAR